MAQLALVEAVNLALARAMADDPDVVVLGQDVGRDGGVFRATLGLLEKFGGYDTVRCLWMYHRENFAVSLSTKYRS